MSDEVVFPKQPYVVDESAGNKAYCVCGFSNNQPYCDGSHKACGKRPIIVDIECDKKVAYCGCRQSRNLPFCDGTHSRLK